MKMGAGAGLLFISPLGVHMRYVIWLHFPVSNNVVEYEALVMSLRIAIELGVRHLDVRGDSQLVIDQVMKNSSCHDPKMEAYAKKCGALRTSFMASNSTTSHVGIMRPSTNWRKSRPNEPRFHRTFSQKISSNHPSTSGRAEASMGHHSTLHLRQKPPRPKLRPCRW
jgi:ribonuclease HI